MPEELITIANFSQVMEAHLSKMRLESEGIECFIADEFTVASNWLFSNAIGGVKLNVKESDVERALAVLQQAPVDMDTVEVGVEIEENEPRCPECSSPDINYERFSRRAVFASWLLLGFPLPFLKRKWKCKECGYQWAARRF